MFHSKWIMTVNHKWEKIRVAYGLFKKTCIFALKNDHVDQTYVGKLQKKASVLGVAMSICYPFSNRCTQLSGKVAKLGQELREEQEMNRCLRANQLQLQTQLQEEENQGQEATSRKDVQIAELQEQLRDIMFYLETQQHINQMPAEARQEIQEGQINIASAPASSQPGPSAAASGKLGGRKGRSKRGK